MADESNENKPDGPTQEEMIASAVSQGLKDAGVNKQAEEPVNDPPVDPYDFSDLDNIDNNPQNDQNQNYNVDQNQQPDYNEYQGYVPPEVDNTRYNELSERVAGNEKIAAMNNFMMELGNEITDMPEMAEYKNTAISEAKKAIARGERIPASEMLSYLHGKSSREKLRTKEVNSNPNIGGSTEIPASGQEPPFDLENATADEIREKYKDRMF